MRLTTPACPLSLARVCLALPLRSSLPIVWILVESGLTDTAQASTKSAAPAAS